MTVNRGYSNDEYSKVYKLSKQNTYANWRSYNERQNKNEQKRKPVETKSVLKYNGGRQVNWWGCLHGMSKNMAMKPVQERYRRRPR